MRRYASMPPIASSADGRYRENRLARPKVSNWPRVAFGECQPAAEIRLAVWCGTRRLSLRPHADLDQGPHCERILLDGAQRRPRARAPLSRRETTLFVVHILAATSSCIMPAAVRAATRSPTSACNVRSAASGRDRPFCRSRFVRNARFLAKVGERSSTVEVASLVCKNANSHERTRLSAIRTILRPIRADSEPRTGSTAVRIFANRASSATRLIPIGRPSPELGR